MSDSVFEKVDDVYKLGGDNFGHNLTNQGGFGGGADTAGANVAPDGLAAALGGDVLQSSKQLTAGGTVGDTETNNTSITVLNIS
jgi:hypothetical protein